MLRLYSALLSVCIFDVILCDVCRSMEDHEVSADLGSKCVLLLFSSITNCLLQDVKLKIESASLHVHMHYISTQHTYYSVSLLFLFINYIHQQQLNIIEYLYLLCAFREYTCRSALFSQCNMCRTSCDCVFAFSA